MSADPARAAGAETLAVPETARAPYEPQAGDIVRVRIFGASVDCLVVYLCATRMNYGKSREWWTLRPLRAEDVRGADGQPLRDWEPACRPHEMRFLRRPV